MFSFILILGVSLLAAITVHEAAHAWAANYLGDPTAKLMGRLSLNPLVHLDPVGTLVFIVSAFAGLPFGWGKPVQFDPYNLKNPKKDAALISIAGPISNLIFASILSLVYRLLPNALFQELIIVNVVLAIFNLIPIHPLDGEKVLVALLPNREARQFDLFMNRYGFFLLIVLIFPIFGGTSIVSIITTPVVSLLLKVFLP